MEVRNGDFRTTMTYSCLPKNELGLKEKTTLFELLIIMLARIHATAHRPAEGLYTGDSILSPMTRVGHLT